MTLPAQMIIKLRKLAVDDWIEFFTFQHPDELHSDTYIQGLELITLRVWSMSESELIRHIKFVLSKDVIDKLMREYVTNQILE